METPERNELSVIIGKTSNNELRQIPLSQLPHLFLLYSDQDQLQSFLNRQIKNWEGSIANNEIDFALALSQGNAEKLFANNVSTLRYSFYNRTNPDQGSIASRYIFMQDILKELKKRKVNSNKKINRRVPLVVISDDIFELVITKRKYTGLYFLQLLIEGPAYGIHFMIASIRVYRNLINQLMAVNPVLKDALRKLIPDYDFSITQPLGAELIITPEDLYFFKTREQMDYDRYFPAEN